MNVFSPPFLMLFLIAVLIVTVRARAKKKSNSVVQGKHIAIIGRKLETPLTVDTPYACLLDDGHKFGDGYRDKEEPKLPHNEACQCSSTSFVQRNYDVFTKNPAPEPPHASDLGDLNRSEARYYKYMLIAHHQDATDDHRQAYLELAGQVEVPSDFKDRVKSRLRLSE